MSSSELQDYLTAISRLPVLCKETQLRHCRRIHTWVNWPEGRSQAPLRVRRAGQRSMDVMIATNTKLVVSVAKRYQGRGVDLMDLIQEGNLGLIRGLELYDPTRGYALSTYAYWWVRQSITRAIQTHSRTIRLPVHTYEILSRARRYISDCAAASHTPTPDEIASHCSTTTDRLVLALEQFEVTACRSLDALVTEDGNPLIDLIGHDPTEANHADIQLAEDTRALHTAMQTLPLTEARVLNATFFEDCTQSALASDLGVSRARVGQIQRAGIDRLRRAFGAGVA